jgi:RNA polymerase sigma-70 factor (ECF subfamily)
LGQADDATLVQAVQRGESEAFEPLLDRHLAHVRTFLALKAPVSHLVDELAHETFVYAYRNIQKFEADTSFRAWLRAIAWNLLRAEIQRFSREQANQARFAQQGQRLENQMDLQASDEPEYLRQCLEQVPGPMRQLLTLKYRDECSTDEIARQLGRSLAWVRTVLFRLRQQLKTCIKDKARQARPC